MSGLVWQTLAEMPCAFGGPVGRGVIRSTPDDFRVDEILGFEPDGEGEHVLLQLRKRETNTLWLARQLARLAKVPNRDVSYAGLKDRHALTSQWFSVRLAGQPEPDWRELESEQVELLRAERHLRKLRIGALQGNRFRLLIRELSADKSALEQRLRQIQNAGMPNYFGEQRFGHDYGNLDQATALFEHRLGKIDRKLRGLLISAARSQLFNQLLAARIEQGNWNRAMSGDHMKLAGSRSGFPIEWVDETISKRCRESDIHPSGPLWGRGSALVSGESLQLEEAVLAPFATWRSGLEHVGLEQDRRPLRIRLDDLNWRFPDHDSLLLEFSLPAGSYATVLLRELLKVDSANLS
ncbi:MAG: tRNA pseudouridine(13) synthase TruD [Pseudomonadota bacterium]